MGVEPSNEMLARAHIEPGVTYIRGDGRTVNVGREFDAVLALFHVLSYQRSLADVRAFFHNAARHLRPGGLFGFDVWFTPAVHSLKPESRVLTRENSDYRVVREATPVEDVLQSLVDVKYRYSVTDKKTNKTSHFEEIHPMRHFTKTEIELFGEEAGFDIVDSLEFMTDDQPSRDTWGVWFTLKKR
jgi:SAM-dependent methyltransferase